MTMDNELEYFNKDFDNNISKSVLSRAVTYTRISSEGQSNFSIDSQVKMVNDFCELNCIEIVKEFGGTHESAKSDDRKELKKLLSFVKTKVKSRDRITHLVVAYTDRISRSDENITLYEKLKKLGLKIVSASEGQLPEGTHGDFMLKMKLIYANYENNLRRDKCVRGIVEKIARGEVVGAVPMGYDLYGPRVNSDRRKQNKQEIKINEEGELLKMAWGWKLNGYPDSVILERLHGLGLKKMYKQKLSAMWTKPFYCGVIKNKHLGRSVRGNWKPLVSIEDFKIINDGLNRNDVELDVTATENHKHRPLQGFVYCPACGKKFTGYLSKKSNTHYYKCNTKGCKGGNLNADTTQRAWKSGAHDLFKNFLEGYSLHSELKTQFKAMLEAVFSDLNKESISQRKLLRA